MAPNGQFIRVTYVYTALKARLLTAYQLTNIQRVEMLFNLPPLGAQKPQSCWRR